MPGSHDTFVALVGSYVPRRCGIATFTYDLATALANGIYERPLEGNGEISIVAINDRDEEYAYGPEVAVQIAQHRKEDYRVAADILNTSKVDVIAVQHEYGLFGGTNGDYLFEMLKRLQKPVVATLHTVLSDPSPGQREVLHRLCDQSNGVMVMAKRAEKLLHETYGVPLERVRMIHHGVPDVPFCGTEPFKHRFGLEGRPTILTFGLLSPNKGIEMMLDALGKVVPDHPDLAYIVLGVTHPGVRRESGESYRISLERRAVDLGIHENVVFHNRYVSLADLCEYLQAADIYVTPYCVKEQIVSGTLAYALACGKAIISTPYWHAQELLAENRGRLIDFGDVDALASNLRNLLENPDERNALRRSAYSFGRKMIWPRVARQYHDLLREARDMFARQAQARAARRKTPMRLSLPELRLDHLYAMTDGTGIIQHAVYATPDRRHGYATDDNARALIVTATVWSLFRQEKILPYLQRYLSFLHYSHTQENRGFRNFMAYDRRWLEPIGSEDCQGRVMWALGHLVSHAPSESFKQIALDLFRNGLQSIEVLKSPRSWTFCLLGLHYYLREFGEDSSAKTMQSTLANRLNGLLAQKETDEWPWFENVVTYDNGRIPKALIRAGMDLDDEPMTERGLRLLRWLLDVQTAERGHLSIIGNQGWLRRNGNRASYDQQPLEPAALIDACKTAYRVTGNSKWLVEMRRCFEWYLGKNDQGLSMIDFKTRGCYDGLMRSGINPNQGAESLLSWLLSLLTLYEMHTGEHPDDE